ncbi:MAG: Gfo/Idh/MocA family oxidoreductase [Terriglobia bacterium]
MSNFKLSRRSFNKSVAVGTASLAMSAGPAVRNVLGANDRIGVGLIGSGGQGAYNLRSFAKTGQIDVVALCDVNDLPLNNAVASLNLPNGKARTYKDFRQLLDNKEIDAVIVATPEHWHAIPMIMACQAGKDVYVEKPISHTIAEGRKMVEAANRYNRVVQCGTQQRSGEHFQKVVELIRQGRIGRVTAAETWVLAKTANQPKSQASVEDSDPPPGLDWDFWLGPAPYHPYNRNRHKSWSHYWETAGGEMTNWAVHLIDIVHWATGVDAPRTVVTSGGQFLTSGVFDTPDTVEAIYEYPGSPTNENGFLMKFYNRAGRGPDGHLYGMEFYGTEGTLFIDREGYTIWPMDLIRDGYETFGSTTIVTGDGTPQHQPHVENFLECVRSRKKPNSDIETTHRSTSACIMANLSYQLGRKLQWDRDQEQFVNDPQANAKLSKEYRKPWKLS